MFKDYLSIVKVLLMNSFRRNNTNKKKAMLIILVVFCGMLPVLAMLGIAAYAITPKAIDAGIFLELIVVVMTSSQLAIFFFGIFSIIAYMFFSEDAEFLAALPVNKPALFTAKLTMVYINELIISFAILIPMLLIMGISAINYNFPLNAGYFILTFLSVFLLPLIPLLLVSLLAFPMMYVVSFFRRRAVLSTIVIIVLFMGFMGLYFNLMGGISDTGNGPDAPFEIGERYALAFSKLADVMFFNTYYAKAMLNYGNFLLNIGVFALVLSVSMVITITVSSMLYQGSVMAQLEAPRESSGKGQIFEQKSKAYSFFIKDFKMLIRSPSFAFQSFLGPLLTPLLILFMGRTLSVANTSGSEIEQFTTLMTTGFIFFLVSMMLCGTNFVATVAFTREGKFFYINKYLPIPYKDIINGKMYFSVATGLIGTIFTAIVYAITISSNILNIIMFTGALTVLTIGFSYMGIYRDLRKPKLDWNNVQEAVKQNLNAMFPMLIGSVVGIFIMICSMFIEKLVSGIMAWLVLWIIVYIPSIIILLYYKQKLDNNYVRLFNKISC